MKATNIALIVLCGAALVGSTTAFATQFKIQCVNSASGSAWTLQVDDGLKTVDGVPAHITAAGITWRDASSGGAFDLDRSSGILTFTNASSTGGYMLRHQCHLK